MEVLLDLVPDSLEGLFLVMGVEDQEAAAVVGEEDKHQGRISLAQDSLGCWEEGITTAVIAPHNTTTPMVDTTVGTTMGTTMDITMDTTVEGVDTTVVVYPTVQGVSVTTDLYSKTSMELHMVLVREVMRQAGDGATLLGMSVKMPGSHRGSLTTLG